MGVVMFDIVKVRAQAVLGKTEDSRELIFQVADLCGIAETTFDMTKNPATVSLLLAIAPIGYGRLFVQVPS